MNLVHSLHKNCISCTDNIDIDTGRKLIVAGKLLALFCAALLIAAGLPARAEEAAEEQGVQEIQQLLEVSDVENTEGMGLEELTTYKSVVRGDGAIRG